MTFDGTCERGGVGGSNEHPRKLRRDPLLGVLVAGGWFSDEEPICRPDLKRGGWG
jgi:hypothetical protein